MANLERIKYVKADLTYRGEVYHIDTVDGQNTVKSYENVDEAHLDGKPHVGDMIAVFRFKGRAFLRVIPQKTR